MKANFKNITEIKPENRLCWFCTSFHLCEASPNYSEYTPGESFSMTCLKRHWDFDAYNTSQEEFGKMLMTARTCSDFVPVKEIENVS